MGLFGKKQTQTRVVVPAQLVPEKLTLFVTVLPREGKVRVQVVEPKQLQTRQVLDALYRALESVIAQDVMEQLKVNPPVPPGPPQGK